MVFSSTVFLFYFIPIFLLIYYILPKNLVIKNLWFLIASLFFYFWGEVTYIYVLLISILFNYVIGILIANGGGKGVLTLGIVLNLLILIGYKYLSFIVGNITGFIPKGETSTLLSSFENIHLPLGISFFTFQGMSYLIDIYKKDAEPERKLMNLALYIGMFPQLIAGPIVRYKEIAEQIKERQHTIEKVSFGICLFIIGFGYKILIANTMGAQADKAFGLGLESLTTISNWFRDYLYIPLGGNRKGKIRTYVNLATVFVLCGIWHGASWVFLIWGCYHGFFLVIERIGLGKMLSKIPAIFQHLYTLLVVIIGWVFFRAESVGQAFQFLKVMFSSKTTADGQLWMYDFVDNEMILISLAAFFFSTHWINNLFFAKDREWSTLMDCEQLPKIRLGLVWKFLLLLILIVSLSKLVNQTYNPFIYFRF